MHLTSLTSVHSTARIAMLNSISLPVTRLSINPKASKISPRSVRHAALLLSPPLLLLRARLPHLLLLPALMQRTCGLALAESGHPRLEISRREHPSRKIKVLYNIGCSQDSPPHISLCLMTIRHTILPCLGMVLCLVCLDSVQGGPVKGSPVTCNHTCDSC